MVLFVVLYKKKRKKMVITLRFCVFRDTVEEGIPFSVQKILECCGVLFFLSWKRNEMQLYSFSFSAEKDL
jgi:hypothetical protein